MRGAPDVQRPNQRRRGGGEGGRRRGSAPAAPTGAVVASGGAAAPPGAPRGRSAFGEGVAHPPDGEDELRIGRIVLDLVAEMADVDVDGLLVLVEGFVVPDQLQELAPGEDPPRSGGEVAEDLELGGGE